MRLKDYQNAIEGQTHGNPKIRKNHEFRIQINQFLCHYLTNLSDMNQMSSRLRVGLTVLYRFVLIHQTIAVRQGSGIFNFKHI
jgi:hypothetical protein